MPVIEAQRASILVPHDHRHISQMSAFSKHGHAELDVHRSLWQLQPLRCQL
jgi:hypothetical protein